MPDMTAQEQNVLGYLQSVFPRISTLDEQIISQAGAVTSAEDAEAIMTLCKALSSWLFEVSGAADKSQGGKARRKIQRQRIQWLVAQYEASQRGKEDAEMEARFFARLEQAERAAKLAKPARPQLTVIKSGGAEQ